jgi:hypothetical protein
MLLRAVRRHKVVFGVVVVLGVLAGAGFAVLRPPLVSSQVLVYVPASKQIQTQSLIAGSGLVLTAVSRSGPLTFEQLHRQVKVSVSSSTSLTITVSAKTADEAMDAADAVARTYVTLVRSPGGPGGPGGRVMAKVVGSASPGTRTAGSAWVAETAGFGTLLGLVLGVMAGIAVRRAPRRQAS